MLRACRPPLVQPFNGAGPGRRSRPGVIRAAMAGAASILPAA